MDSITLSALSGSFVSLVFKYFPFLSAWYESLDGSRKSIVMLFFLALSTFGVYVVSCYGVYDFGVTCDSDGVADLVKIFFASLVANQGTYVVTKKM